MSHVLSPVRTDESCATGHKGSAAIRARAQSVETQNSNQTDDSCWTSVPLRTVLFVALLVALQISSGTRLSRSFESTFLRRGTEQVEPLIPMSESNPTDTRTAQSATTNETVVPRQSPPREWQVSMPQQRPLFKDFHFIFTTNPETWNWRVSRAIEFVVYHHPNASVTIHSNTLTDFVLDAFLKSGYRIQIKPYNLTEMVQALPMNATRIEKFIEGLNQHFQKGEHWYSHQSDILRYLIMFRHGGVYLDTDMYVLKPLPISLLNSVGSQVPNEDSPNGAIMLFEPKHPFIFAALEYIVNEYANVSHVWAAIGPSLLRKLVSKRTWDPPVTVHNQSVFYPFPFWEVKQCFTNRTHHSMDLTSSYTLHVNTKITAKFKELIPGTLCHDVLERFRVFQQQDNPSAGQSFVRDDPTIRSDATSPNPNPSHAPLSVFNDFHFIFTTSPESWNWRVSRAVEYVFYHHPNATVTIHSNTLAKATVVEDFIKGGFNIQIKPYNLTKMLSVLPVNVKQREKFLADMKQKFQKSEHWYSHQSDIMRFLVMYNYGGVYLDTDMYVLKPLPLSLRNSLGSQVPGEASPNGAIMLFEAKHPYIFAALEYVIREYASVGHKWGAIGPSLLRKLVRFHAWEPPVTVHNHSAFYPFPYWNVKQCFINRTHFVDLTASYTIHLNTKITAKFKELLPGTQCHDVLERYRIFQQGKPKTSKL